MALATKPKPASHLKKTVGRHHKPSKLYLKTYWPYLPLALIVALGIIVNSSLSGSGRILGASSDLSDSALLSATNLERTDNNDRSLQLDNQLSSAAQAKADDMVARNYWSHDTPDGKTPWSFIAAAGYSYQTAGENLAYGFSNASDVLDAWMNSAEHRQNVLNTSYQAVGFEVASATDFNHNGPETIVVAMYASPVSTSPLGSATTTASALRPVARVQLATRSHSSLYIVLAAGSLAMLIFAWRHGKAWHKALLKGEDFLLEHIWVDMIVVAVIMGSYFMVQSAGMIG